MIKHLSGKVAIALAVGMMSSSAWAASHGTGGMGHGAGGMGHGAGGVGHGATVSAAAHSAHASGEKVGPSVRSVARSNSQGPTHASANAISHVQNSPGKANANSVLGTGTTSTSVAAHGHSMAKSKAAKTHGSKGAQEP